MFGEVEWRGGVGFGRCGWVVGLAVLGVAVVALGGVAIAGEPTLKYPAAKKADQVDEYHGVKVAEP